MAATISYLTDVVVAFLFVQYGTTKLLALPGPIMPDGGTAPLASLAGETREVVHPMVRDQDRAMYYRQHADRYAVGSYQHEPLLVDPLRIVEGMAITPDRRGRCGRGRGRRSKAGCACRSWRAAAVPASRAARCRWRAASSSASTA